MAILLVEFCYAQKDLAAGRVLHFLWGVGSALARDINAPAIDLNLMPGSESARYFDGLHLASPSAVMSSERIGEYLVNSRCPLGG